MVKVTTLALTAALTGTLPNAANAVLPGCYPTYAAGSDYTTGDPVSESISEIELAVTESCSDPDNTDASCVSGVRVTTPERTVNVKYNFECNSPSWCGSGGYGPGEQYENLAWMKKEECEGTAALVDFIPDAWRSSNGGCPPSYVAGTDYDAGGIVSVDKGDYSLVYSCTGEPSNQFCGQSGYEPGTGQYWANAWTALGSCAGSLYPTASPNFDVLENFGGCPEEWVQNTPTAEYEEGDTISANGIVFVCKSWPQSGHCGQDGYQPFDADASTADAWMDAWAIAGYCDGSTGPTTSPSYDVLEDMGACPAEWIMNTATTKYEEGDKIAQNGLVFQCKGWPQSGHCGQDGYQPLDADASTADAWKDAWELKGYCSGSTGPTASPIFDDLDEFGDGCPKEWSASDVSGYEYGDLVSIEVSDSPERKVVYQCREWPNGDHCAKGDASMMPGALYGHLGWMIKGSCDGSIAPTISPTRFEDISYYPYGYCQYIKCETDSCNGGEVANYVDGSTDCSCDANPPTGSVCTQKTCEIVDIEHWSSSTTYESGDYVRISGDRYRCKNGNESGWCNVAAYQPTREAGIWTNAWTKDGTMSCSKARKLAPKSRKMMAKAAKPRMI